MVQILSPEKRLQKEIESHLIQAVGQLAGAWIDMKAAGYGDVCNEVRELRVAVECLLARVEA